MIQNSQILLFVIILTIFQSSNSMSTSKKNTSLESTDNSLHNDSMAVDQNRTTIDGPIYVTTETIAPPASCQMEHEDEVSEMLLQKVMPTYNKMTLPNNTLVEARVEISINAIPHFSELDSFFELDLFFSELWHEPRLSFMHLSQSRCVTNVTLGLEYLQKLWTPNICIVNSKAAVIHSSPSENVFLILYQDGTLWKNCRMLVRGPCEIDLRLFPFDIQTCSLIFESYSFNSQKVALQWIEKAAITLTHTVELPDFVLSTFIANRSLVTYPNGQWDQLKATFVFERRYGFFIMQAYLPTYMTVFVAWINFWMDPKELATRATLAISAFLAMCLQLGTVQQNQPRVSYVKAMDIWMLGSISFLFLALIELAIISFMLRTDKRGGRKQHDAKRLVYIPPSPSFGRVYERDEESRVMLAQKYPSRKRKAKSSIYHETAYGCSFRPCQYHQRQWLQSIKQPWMSPSSDDEPATIVQSTCPHHSTYLKHEQEKSTSTMELLEKNYISIVRKILNGGDKCTAYGVDKFFLIVYPPLYLVFNIFYWSYYLT